MSENTHKSIDNRIMVFYLCFGNDRKGGDTTMAVHRAERREKKEQAKGEMKRLQFDFPLPAVQILQELAEETGEPTLAGVVRNALKVYTWIIEEQKQGRRIMSEDKKGQSKRELIPLLKYQSAA
jgi:hypothetical protein